MSKIVVDVLNDDGRRMIPQQRVDLPMASSVYVLNIDTFITAKDYMHVLSARDSLLRENGHAFDEIARLRDERDMVNSAVRSGNELHTSLRAEIACLSAALTAANAQRNANENLEIMREELKQARAEAVTLANSCESWARDWDRLEAALEKVEHELEVTKNLRAADHQIIKNVLNTLGR